MLVWIRKAPSYAKTECGKYQILIARVAGNYVYRAFHNYGEHYCQLKYLGSKIDPQQAKQICQDHADANRKPEDT